MMPLLASLFLVFAAGALSGADEKWTVDCSAPTTPRNRLATFSVGSDRAKIFLRPEHQRSLELLQKEIGFRYLRCHGLFNEEMEIVSRDASGQLQFDWTNVDRFIDALKAVKLKPFLELGFMPEPIASGRQTIFWWKGNVTPPTKQEEWAALVEAFTKHVIKCYGLAEVRSWYFEIWNEPNLDGFWTGGQDKYFELYATSARTIKAVDAKLRVGGPSTAGLGWIPELVEYCRKHSVPLDFISSHAYAAMQGFLDAEGKGGGTVLDTSPDALVGGFRWARSNVPKGMPFFITEWGPSYSPRDPTHDSYICAPFILEKVRGSEGLVDGLSYWTFTDQFEEPGPPHTPFHGGFGLLTVDNLRKPGFLAYAMLAKLDDRELPTAQPRLIVTRKNDRVRLITWDYTPFRQDAPNDPFYHRDLKATEMGTRTIDLTQLKPGRYRVSRWGVGYRRNDVYGAFLELKNPETTGAHLGADSLKALQASYTGPEKQPDIVTQDGNITLTLPMRTNDAWYVELERIGD